MNDFKEKKSTSVKFKSLEAWEDPKRHDKSYRWKDRTPMRPEDVRSTVELMAFLESEAGKDVELEAKVLSFREDEVGYRKIGKKRFLESFKENDKKYRSARKFYESFSGMGSLDSGNFARGGGPFTNTVGNDFTPLLGGPFYKQLYYWNDWLQASQDCFFAANHDAIAKASIDIMINFTLGKGYKVVFTGKDENVASALWAAFEEANQLQQMMRNYARELSIYGEHMIWWLPNNEKYISYPRDKLSLESVPKTFLPRIRLVDPSNIVEIITYPEDQTRVIAYVWLTPTQYQIYTAKDEKTGQVVPTTKFIYQQIPASQMMHYKINCAENEKRGRSDLFAALPYFKRLRDSINYSIIAQQKASAWCIDTTIEGNQEDIQAYVDDQQSQGTIAAAGSEFVHTKAIERKMISNSTGGKGNEAAFEWCLSMCAAAFGIPVSYYGSHLSGGTTRASALVSTEPVAKKFEMRQQIYSMTISDIAGKLLKQFNLEADVGVIFSEIITQDRSQKLKDIYLAETAKWITPERAATMGAQEMAIDDYSYEDEIASIKSQKDNEPLWANPLSAPPGVPTPNPDSAPPPPPTGSSDKPSSVTKNERKAISDNYGA